MAACKAMLGAAHGVAGSSMVTAMCRNGLEFGIRVSGTGGRWFTAPAPLVDGLSFPGYSIADAAPHLRDRAHTQTAPLRRLAAAAAPPNLKFLRGTAPTALAHPQIRAPHTIRRH